MSNSFSEQIEQAMETMRAEHARAVEARDELAKATVSVTSKDRLVTVKVGPQGQVVSMTFHTTGYREMAPAQLATLLTDLLNEARATMGEKVIQAMKGFDGIGDMLRVSMSGGGEIDEMLEPLRAMMPGYDAEAAAGRAGKQEEFGG
ncbi:YbaB/EbfC family nucleoid-associated protein [Kitasatospora sp. NPDC049258]|uniref:YbaB/EbfC family nucleoid-associated protein n=1 Tax=Kitasatospora sp. NPDC049258 TaxID=3155394 RepID=UPI0034269946